MAINRRGFFASLAALVVAPGLPVPATPAYRFDAEFNAIIRDFQRRADAMLALLEESRRLTINPDEMRAYRDQVTAELRRSPRVQ